MRGRPTEADLQAERSTYRSVRTEMEKIHQSIHQKSPKIVFILFDHVFIYVVLYISTEVN